ncbi:glycosyltransferase family 4 protein [Pedobacter cryotolerans]|uniref:Glycosyltransferase family 4 protein n=1 Tax=Pedobacter cryotolerans TaxID=2571270 RepID=A0A4U1C2C8_9SPHI|nr:glycosyltransferase family 4 protein [Pedobacter cryotolerans]TKB99362.1 glycosyltransferase family 4 protein [Pedobacter cryotolerans]
MSVKKLLIIGLVWPEPTSSAAGTRMIQLIELFLANDYQITFACAAAKSEFSYNLQQIGVNEQSIKLNDQSFNDFIISLNPQIVMFDRFVMEEQYGWRVQQECPEAMTILDTEDLHFLRKTRQKAIKEASILKNEDLFNDDAKREIASILRCDLSLIISEQEINILQNQFKIDPSLLHYLPFLEDEITATANWLSFEERKDFIFIGNFLHEPNWQTVLHLKIKIWPLLSKLLPQAKLHIYGAYPSQKVLQLHNPKENFYVVGRADDAKQTIAKHRILLAPILFGAGVKGKFIDAMHVGTPSVTTTIGAEAMKGNLDWNGYIEDDVNQFISKAIELYQNKALWLQAQQNGVKIINERFSKNKFSQSFIQQIEVLSKNLKTHRQQNFVGQLLHYHTNQSTKYMSLWIEEKNK